jgi:corrinoid protein of di/trimethylamine methyltransferase
MENLQDLYNSILNGNAKVAKKVTEDALAAGVDPQDLVHKYLIPAMDHMGKRFEVQDCFVPELLISARAMKASLELIRPLLAARGTEPIGRVAIGTIKGDLHDIGKNLVGAMLEGGGFEVVDLGTDVSPEKFVQTVEEKNVQIVGMSALLTTTMINMQSVIDAFKGAGIRDKVKIIIGGAPITQQYADKIGADGFSNTAVGAVALSRKLLGVGSS